MSSKYTISKEHFLKRIGDLCLRSGLSGFPKNEADQHILLKSAVLVLGAAETFTEKEINERLDTWINQVSQNKAIDRITLRRRLVDTGYLSRSKDGACYQVAQPGPQTVEFEAAINQLDMLAVITAAREEMARKKREYLERSRRG